MRIALISDLHANLIALRAVFEDIEREGVDQTICLGDVATLGPAPSEVLELLGERGIPCILGNHDAFMLDADLIRTYTEAPIVVEAVDWCRDQLSKEEIDFIRAFRAGLDLELAEGISLALFHGTPRSHMEDMLATTPAEKLDEMLDGRTATVMAGGHTSRCCASTAATCS